MTVTEKTHKASVSIREVNWKKLSTEKNKSKIVNQALNLYFNYESSKQKFEEDYYKDWLDASLKEVDRNEVSPMPTKDGEIDFDAFEREIGM